MSKIKINYKNILRKIADVSEIDVESIDLVKLSSSTCSSCSIDPYTKKSTNPSCPACGGKGKSTSITTYNILANLDVVSGLENEYETGGKLQVGQIIATIHVDEFTRLELDVNDFFKTTIPYDHFAIHNKKYNIVSVMPERLNGTLYDIVIILELAKA